MRQPYKVIVWGPGNVGKAVLKIIHGRPEFELVGVLCHSFGKGGVDVGQYIGKEHLGLRMTRDREEILGLDADVVVYTGLPAVEQATMDADVCRLLESGKNVISITAYNNPRYHGSEYVKQFEEACRKGNTSLHGSGELPGFFLDRVALTMTGLCKEVRHLRLEEWYNISNYKVSVMGFFGINSTLEEAHAMADAVGPQLLSSYAEALNLVSEAIFDQPCEVDFAAEFSLAEEMMVFPGGTVAEGKVSELHWTFSGKIGGAERLQVALNWSFTLPERWTIDIEGDPVSTHTEIEAFASLDRNAMFRAGDTTRVGSYCTAMPVVQSIPIVVEASPGLVYPDVFANAMPDFRKLAGRSSIAP